MVTRHHQRNSRRYGSCFLNDGKKSIRKEKTSRLLRKVEVSRDAMLAARSLLADYVVKPQGQFGLRTASVDQCTSNGAVCAPAQTQLCLAEEDLHQDQHQDVLDSGESTASSKHGDSLLDCAHTENEVAKEYNVLLQNLPKSWLTSNMLRDMVKGAELEGVKKVAFSPDGKAVVTLKSYSGLWQCIAHFNGMPWFHAPMCMAPTIVATHMQEVKTEIFGPRQVTSNLSANAAVFVPGTAQFTSDDFTNFSDLADKVEKKNRNASHAGTYSGSSSDESSCWSDSEMETEANGNFHRQC